jgi:hypothetical protein
LLQGSRRNLKIGLGYVRAKLVEVLVLEAFAELSGGSDVPLELMAGPKPRSRETPAATLGYYLAQARTESRRDTKDRDTAEVLKLLDSGRAYRSKFDSKTSALGAFIYSSLGGKELGQLESAALEYAEGKRTAMEYLGCFPQDLLQEVGAALAEVVPQRRGAIAGILTVLVGKRVA